MLPITGCWHNYGAGGTGEWIVPRQQLRDVQPLDLSTVSSAPPRAIPAATSPVGISGATTAPSSQAAATSPATLPAPPPATQPLDGNIPITLEEVRQLALANNLDLRVELFNPTIARESLTQERAQFESVFTTSIDYARLDEPTASRLNSNQEKDLSVTPGARIPLQTGGEIDLNVPMTRLETDNAFSTLNPAYRVSPAARLSLPLLRGFGTDFNARGIRVAFYQSQAAQARTKLEVIRVLADAERAYWRLYAAARELEVHKQEYDLAVAQLNRARHQVKVGTVAEVEVVRAESGVSDTVETVINSENTLRDRQRALKRILNRPDLPIDSAAALVPATPPSAVSYKLDAPRVAELAVQNRMELLETELAIAQENANVAAARNNVLPLVTLDYTYSVPGLGGSFQDAWAQVRGADFQDHRLGINVEIPIGNEARRSQLRASLARRLQQLATKEQRTLQIRQEVYNTVDQLETNWQRIIAARERVRLNVRTLEAEQRQFEQGLRTSTDVLDATIRLANAESAEISAITDYQISQIDIAFATGTLLGASHVQWSPAAAPAIDR